MRRRDSQNTRPLSLFVAIGVCVIVLAAFAGIAIANVTTGGNSGFDASSAGSSPEPTPTPTPTPAATPAPAPAPAPTPPTLTTVKGPTKVASGKQAKFTFKSTTAGATFVCKVDGKPFKACKSPYQAPKLSPGKHTFVVQSVDSATGLRSTVSKTTFQVQKAPKPKKNKKQG